MNSITRWTSAHALLPSPKLSGHYFRSYALCMFPLISASSLSSCPDKQKEKKESRQSPAPENNNAQSSRKVYVRGPARRQACVFIVFYLARRKWRAVCRGWEARPVGGGRVFAACPVIGIGVLVSTHFANERRIWAACGSAKPRLRPPDWLLLSPRTRRVFVFFPRACGLHKGLSIMGVAEDKGDFIA